MSTDWERVFGTEVPDEWLKDGETAHMNYHIWRNEVVLFKFCCECGGESWLVPVLCDWVDGTYEVQGVCKQCERRLSARVHFFIL